MSKRIDVSYSVTTPGVIVCSFGTLESAQRYAARNGGIAIHRGTSTYLSEEMPLTDYEPKHAS